ncbi:MAG TPA: amidohydrolase family protein [Planctomycetota bacterium]|nr:amidohydrolase family protein [Planctomycetota bacterium]
MSSRGPSQEGVVSGIDVLGGGGLRLRFRAGRIERAEPGGKGPFVGPGLVDLQLNGFRGLDFNTLPVPPDLPGDVTRELYKEGVTSYLATVITNSPSAIEEAVRAIARACAADPEADAAIAGIHLEGPFIAREDGPRGAHERKYVRAPDWGLVRRWQEEAEGRIRLVTMSPEWPGSSAFIRTCVAHGIAVSIGHTAATPEEIRQAVRAGASLSTHLGNGAHLTLPRHPNYLWEQLAQDALRACIIADGFHLPDSVIKVVMRVKGANAMLASDAVYLSGLAPGRYTTHIGGKVVLTRDGRLHLASNPKLLAGSVMMLRQGVDHLVRAGLCDLAEAWEMASTRPAEALGLAARRGLRPEAPADVVVFERSQGRVVIRETWKGGRLVHGGK